MAVNKKTVKLGNRMKERWSGPFKVEAMSTKGVSTLVDSQAISKRRQKVNVRDLKPIVRRTGTAEDVDIASDVQELTVLCDISEEAVNGECRYFCIYTFLHR